VRLERAKIAAPKRAEIKAQKALAKEHVNQAKADEKAKKKRPRDGSDTIQDDSFNSKRKRFEDTGDIEATVANSYDRPRLNFRRS